MEKLKFKIEELEDALATLNEAFESAQMVIKIHNEKLILMVGYRNETLHNYDRVKADEIAGNIKSDYDLMDTVTKEIKKKLVRTPAYPLFIPSKPHFLSFSAIL